MRSSFRLKTIILGAAAGMLALSVAVAALTWIAVGKITKTNRESVVENEFETLSDQAKYHVVQIQQFLTDASLTHENDSIKEAKENLEALEKDFDDLARLHPEMSSDIEAMRAQGRRLTEVGLKMTAAYWQKGKEAGDEIMKAPNSGLDAISEEMGKLLEDFGARAVGAQRQADENLVAAVTTLQWQSMVLSAFSILATIGVFMLLFRRLEPLNRIIVSLSESANELTEVGSSLRQSSDSISMANQNQAISVQQTAAGLTEIRSMVERTSDNASRLSEGAQTSHSLVATGKSNLSSVQKHLDQIRVDAETLVREIESGNKDILGIVGIIGEIEAKTNVINDIVFQTKLLSFNASVEAARAGEHGKGFAVVAEEIGNLAAMSGQAAREISEMLSSGIDKAKGIIDTNAKRTERSIVATKEKIDSGVKTAAMCERSFDEIVDQVSDVKNFSDEIALAIAEQTKGIDEIDRAMHALESAAHKNVEASSVVAENSKALGGSISELNKMAEEVRVVVEGGVASLSIDSSKNSNPTSPAERPSKINSSEADKLKRAA